MKNFVLAVNNAFTLDVFLIAVFVAVFNGVLLCFIAYRPIQTLQLRGYKTERYMHWIKNTHGKFFSRLFMLCFMSASALLVINILFDAFGQSFISYISLLVYFIYLIAFIKNDFTHKKKTPLVFTSRVKRLITLFLVFGIILTYALILFSFYLQSLGAGWLKYFFICFTPLLTPFVALTAFILLLPFENLHNHNYVIRANKKLQKMPALIRIGITGSYGKTSVKNILHIMLSKKYNVLSSPGSYNTPMGLTKTILKQLNRSHEVFIAEMGARYRGDIRYICDFIRPGIGIITSVGNQHLETFKTVDNLKNTKFELIESLPESGFAVFNSDSEGAAELCGRCKKDKVFTSLEKKGSFVQCGNIETDENGIGFDLQIGGEKTHCRSKLVGKHNISNIMLCAAAAYKLGVGLSDICEAIKELEPVPHRLEITKANGISIIDDSFNASSEGTAAALEVLSSFKGGNKIIVTPGLVELGQVQDEENYNFGKRMAAVCGCAVLVGENQTAPIKKGLLDSGFDEGKIITVNSLEEAKGKLGALLKAGDTVLFENDLPDNYSEQ